MRLAGSQLERVTRSPLAAYALVAITAASADLVSKFVAVRLLGEDAVVELFGRLSLMVVFNTGSAGGVMIGPYTWQLNVMVTLAAIVLITSVAKALIAADRRAMLALGLVAGGALGNVASLLVGPNGVADFLALRLTADRTIVMNVADLALWSGALALLPVILTLLKAIRAEHRARGTLAKA
ncbi:MAG: signal peptidase II [Gemmatimonas sp.]